MHILVYALGNTDATRFSQCFQSGRDIDAVPQNIITIDDNITEINANAKYDLLVFGRIGVSLAHAILDSDGTTDSINHARKFQ